MNTDNQASLDQRIESALSRLPAWQAPPDFAKRLAAAAARQAAAPVAPWPSPDWTRFVPMALWSVGFAAVLAWAVPWAQLSGMALAWGCVAAMATSGALLTLQVLRQP